MERTAAEAFAREWIEAWNTHDLDRILSHYASGIEFLSPVAQRRVGNGRVMGVEALRSYWRQGLEAQPNLAFELVDVLVGHQALTILYRNHRGERAAETFVLDDQGRVVRSCACYAS